MWGDTDFYKILGVSPLATVEEIKSAYRMLARRYHPDTSEEEHLTQMFRDVHDAYTVLVDVEQRKAYDRWRIERGIGGMTEGSIRLEVLRSHEQLLSMDEPQMFYVLLDIMSGNEVTTDRLPINLCLVVDRSTSMKGARLQKLKDAAREIVDRLDKNDVLSMVTFSDRAQVVIPGHSNINKLQAKGAINNIQAGGGTEIYQGLTEGMQQINQWRSARYVNHLILLTDGQTYGDEDLCINMAQNASMKNIGISTVGVGSDWNDKLLDEIASRGGGSSYYLQGPAEIVDFFQDKIQQLADVFALQSRLTVRVGEGVSLYSVFKLSPVLDSLPVTTDRFELGAISVRTGQAVFLEMLIHPRSVGNHRISRFTVTASLPMTGNGTDQIVEREVDIDFVDNIPEPQHIPRRIVSVLNNISIYRMQQKALADLDQGRTVDATRRLEVIATRLLNMGELELAKAALLEAGQVSKTGTLSAEGRKKLKYGTRSLSGREPDTGGLERSRE